MRYARTRLLPLHSRMVLHVIALVVIVGTTAHASFARVPAVAQDAKEEKKNKKNKPEKDGPGAAADQATVGSSLSSEEMQRLLSLHNKLRADVGIEPLAWSAEVAVYAQKWADHLASKGAPAHRPRDNGEWKQLYGENIFAGIARSHGVADAVQLWATEKSLYSGQLIAIPSPSFLHYTQIVWKASTQIGCGKAERDGKVFIVCNYAPAGNIPGQKPY